MYKAGHKQKSKRRKLVRWLVIFAIMLILAIAGGAFIKSKLRPNTVLKQAKPTTSKVSYNDTAVKHYDEPDFTIDVPSVWQVVPRPAGPYNRYDWQISHKSTNGEVITVYEDTIPVNFAVNRVLIVEAEDNHISLKGSASDNCSTYTKDLAAKANQVGAPAKWQGIDFLCDQLNTERDVIGTSSVDGINTVTLKSPSTGKLHKFFFTYTGHSINPDYTVFYNAASSFRLK